MRITYLLAFRLDLGRYRFKDTGGSRDTLQYRYHSGVFLPVLYRSVTCYRYPPTTSRQSRQPGSGGANAGRTVARPEWHDRAKNRHSRLLWECYTRYGVANVGSPPSRRML